MTETSKHTTRKEMVLAQLSFSGQRNLSKEKMDKLFHHLQQRIEDVTPEPPCEGGSLITWKAGWEQVEGKTCFVDRITWVCPPDGHLVEVVTTQC